MIFGCWHRYLYFKSNFQITFSNNLDIEFKIAPAVCVKCKKVKWKYVGGNL